MDQYVLHDNDGTLFHPIDPLSSSKIKIVVFSGREGIYPSTAAKVLISDVEASVESSRHLTPNPNPNFDPLRTGASTTPARARTTCLFLTRTRSNS